MSVTERILAGVCGGVVLAAVGFGGYHAAQNPMHERLSELELSMAAVRYLPEEFVTRQDVNYTVVGQQVLKHENLWKELVAPPAAPAPKAAAGPNLKKMLDGVVVSLRQEITGSDGRTMVNIKIGKDDRGSFMGVGDTVKGLTIHEVTRESVIFLLKKGGKEHTHALKRR